MITITSKKDGFRRCGVAHSATATEYPDDRFSAEELAALKAEPMLTVVVTADKAAGDDKKDAGKDKKAETGPPAGGQQ